MALVLRSLSDFKRFLSEPGATIQVVRNTFIDRQPASFADAYRAKGMYEPRTIRAISKKAAIFSIRNHPTTIWLYWDKGTRKWRFQDDTVAIPLDTGLGPPDEIVYRCSYAPGMDPEVRAPVRRAKTRPSKPPDTLKAASKAPPAVKSAGLGAASATGAKTAPTPVMPVCGQGRLL
ncbi:hypothetical protein [Methylobacterium sp. J-068]|uniref:hypothetical protein n=1 Tax=Methylobacterium sp. J-068 TaxID=2836649 RepID=UPI0039197DB4